MLNFALDGLWLVGGLIAAYVTGVFTAQYVKDKILGIPSDLRAALKTTETAAQAQLKASQAKMVADVASLLSRGNAAVSADAKAAVISVEAKVAALAAPAAPAVPLVASVVPLAPVVHTPGLTP
jgi:hypothetical protein